MDPFPAPAAGGPHCLFEPGRGLGHVPSRPWDTRGKHSVPPAGSDHPFVPTQSILAQFLFLSLALFLHLPCQKRGDRGVQSGEPAWPVVQTTRKALQFFSPSFYSIRVTHLCTSPLECEIAGVCHAELGRFSMQITGGSLCSRLLFCCSLSPRIGRTTESNSVGFGVCNTHETALIPFLIEISAPK